MTESSTLRSAIGPGLLMAGAAIGVSHLVQATRAGADYGLALLGLIVLGCALKYPFLEFGPRYAAATGENMLVGYRRLGRWALGLYAFITVSTMCIVLASVTLVTAGLAGSLLGLGIPVAWVSAAILLLCALILALGHYRGLDLLMKWLMAVLALSTLTAVALAAGQYDGALPLLPDHPWQALVSGAGLAFVLALLGWMPIPLDAAAWHSLWTLERSRATGRPPSVRHATIDFALGYAGAVVLAVAFLLLGALLMFGRGLEFSGSAVAFANQLITLYGEALGPWARPLIGFAALATMFSTTLTVADAFPRVLRGLAESARPTAGPAPQSRGHRLRYLASMLLIMAGALLVITRFGARFTLLIDFITTVSFLAAPVIAWLNLRLLTSVHTPAAAQPGPVLRALAWAGLLFLAAFSLLWVALRTGLLQPG